MAHFSSKYGVARHIYINVPKAGSANHAANADWTPAAGDVKISKDGGAAANVTNLPVAIAMGNSAIWDFSLTATEMQAAQVNITISDSVTKAVDDTGFVIETYGNASAQHAFDLGTASTAQTGDAFARLGAPAGASVSADLLVIDNFVDGIEATLAAGVTVVANNDKTGYTLSAAGVLAIWDASTAALTTVGSIGKKLADWVVGTIDTYTGNTKQTGDSYARLGAPAGASVSADVAAVKSDSAAILVDTAEIGIAGAGLTALASAANLATAIAYVDTIEGTLAAGVTLTAAERTAIAIVIATTQMTESYRADGAAPTPSQAFCEILAHLGEAGIVGTTKTLRKFDGSTAVETFSLDSPTAPTSITRAT